MHIQVDMHANAVVPPIFLIMFEDPPVRIETCAHHQQTGRAGFDAQRGSRILDQRAGAHIDPVARDDHAELRSQNMRQRAIERIREQAGCVSRVNDDLLQKNGLFIDGAAALSLDSVSVPGVRSCSVT